MNQNYRNLLLPCIPDTLHCPGSQISLIIINRHQVAGLIHHVAISLDIALTAILVSNDFFPAAMLQDKLHPALTARAPHPDQGWQYQHKQYQRMLREKGIR